MGLVRRLLLGLPGGDWAIGSALVVLGLPFAHVVGAIPAAISAGLNIALARVLGSRLLRLMAAPLCGAVSGLVYLPISTTMHDRHWFTLFTMALCALTSLVCVAIHERHGAAPVPAS